MIRYRCLHETSSALKSFYKCFHTGPDLFGALYLDAANDILNEAGSIFSDDKIFKKLADDDHLKHHCKIEGNKIILFHRPPERVLEQLITAIIVNESENLTNQLKLAALKAVVSRKLPPIGLGRDATESMVKIPRKIFRG